MSDLTYTFDTESDARRYLREVGRLWAAWMVGLGGLLLTNALLLLGWAVVTLAALVVLARPIQRRAEALVPVNKVEGGKVDTIFRGGTTRDRAIRDLAYGTEPMRAALQTAGYSQHWVFARHFVLAMTLLGFIYVVAGPRP